MYRSDDELWSDWNKEQEVLFLLSHPNIVRIYDAFIYCGQYHIVLEKASSDLRTYVTEKGPLSEKVVQTLAGQLLSGLACIHSMNIVHRDLQIDNILVFRDSSNGKMINFSKESEISEITVKIADFGICKVLEEDEDMATSKIGRDFDFAPELLTYGYTNKQSDLYQIGLILYFCLTGKCVISWEDGDVRDVTVSGLARQRALQLGTPLGRVIADMLHLCPEMRFNTCLDTWAAIRDCQI
eukprot:TRINITY_DN2189_c0_g1_i2.p1 TRINITY_DN2189_c0_g1~~TRINITY_DN2189_c0_g1_i2.p1  ORF type:complete len:240 (+),score=42.69 TRINITY_DN2189_c0_g1_i2:429-1148(+)